ncbi:MAG: hypothetical protein HYX81_02965, partial [Chloroflexi bacterium]|nr:hypothetical protein [Chloroflexota bacterium]
MSEAPRLPESVPGGPVRAAEKRNGTLLYFDNLAAFSQAVETETGITFDFQSVIELTADFVESSERYLILNAREFDVDAPNNLLFMTEGKNFLFSKKPLSPEATRPFEKVLARPYGRSTVIAFVTLDRVLDGYRRRFESLLTEARKLETEFDPKIYRTLAFEFDRMSYRLEDFQDLLLRLQERGYKQVETRYISFDYNVLIAESGSLQNRCRRRLATLTSLQREYEMRTTTELNLRMEKLTDIMKKLTSITVIFMIPTLVASHFGMNFAYMPELDVQWAYPLVIIIQLVLMGLGVIIFRKIG